MKKAITLFISILFVLIVSVGLIGCGEEEEQPTATFEELFYT